MDADPLDRREDAQIHLMRLAPYAALLLNANHHQVGDAAHISFAVEDFKLIIKHFLGLIPFDEEAYLRCSKDVRRAIASGTYKGSALQHFVNSGYFEGRRPAPNYLPEDHEFAAAVRHRSRDFFVAMYRASSLYAQCDYLSAERYFRQALRQCPDSFHANRLLGYILYRTGRMDLAVGPLRAAERIRPHSPDICMWLANIYQTFAMPEARLEVLEAPFAKYGLHDLILARAMADALRDLGRYKHAFVLYSLLPPSALGGGGIAAKNATGRALTDARQRLRKLIKEARSAPLRLTEQIDLACDLASVGFSKRASMTVNRISAAGRRGTLRLESASLLRLADAARVSRGVRGALHLTSSFASHMKASTKLQSYKGILLYRSGDLSGAIEVLSQLAATEPRDEVASQYLTLAYLRSGQAAEALSICRSWMNTDPDATHPAALALLVLASASQIPFIRVPGSDESNDHRSAGSGVLPVCIVQFWNDADPPSDVLDAMASWKENNPEIDYRRFSDSSARDFMAFQLGRVHAAAYDACAHPAARADYFRLGFLARNGGFYVDADEWNRMPLAKALAFGGGRVAILAFKDRAYIPNSPLCCAPEWSLMEEMLEAATRTLVESKSARTIDTWQALGPGLLTRFVAKALLSESSSQAAAKQVAFLREVDTSRITAEGMFEYKGSRERNWRFQTP